jgi:hypothetical protein
MRELVLAWAASRRLAMEKYAEVSTKTRWLVGVGLLIAR